MGHNYFCNVPERMRYLMRKNSVLPLTVIVSLIWSADYKACHIILSLSLSHILLLVTHEQLYLTFTATVTSLLMNFHHICFSCLSSPFLSLLSADWPVPSPQQTLSWSQHHNHPDCPRLGQWPIIPPWLGCMAEQLSRLQIFFINGIKYNSVNGKGPKLNVLQI